MNAIAPRKLAGPPNLGRGPFGCVPQDETQSPSFVAAGLENACAKAFLPV